MLRASNNHITHVSPGIFSRLKRLHGLHLSSNYLSFIPEEISACSKISDLRLNQNLFTEVPPVLITRLPELRSLNMMKNRLRCLPMLPSRPDLRLAFDHNPDLNHLPFHLASKLSLKHCRRGGGVDNRRDGDNAGDQEGAAVVGVGGIDLKFGCTGCFESSRSSNSVTEDSIGWVQILNGKKELVLLWIG